MTVVWDETTDLLVAGTGAAALGAAIAAAESGLAVIVAESTDKWGGTTFLSGGGMWLPDNPLMRRDKAGDSLEAALTYMEEIIHDVGPASSRARKVAFINGVADVVLTLEQLGLRWIRSSSYPDYFSHRPGGRRGRSLEVAPFDVNKLGAWYAKTRAAEVLSVPVRSDDFARLALGWSSARGLAASAQVATRAALGWITRRKLRGVGVALSSSMMLIVRNQNTPVWLEAPVVELIMADGQVAGAAVQRDGKTLRIRTRKGVFLGTGGFARNRAWREIHHGIQGWSATAPGDTGTGIQIAMDVGAQTAMMHLAWGTPVIPFLGDDSRGSLLIWERSMPHSLLVDGSGHRFVNESLPYVEFVQAILDHDRRIAVPCWIVADHRHTRRYVNLASLLGVDKLKAEGTIVEAPSLDALANKIGVDGAALRDTVERFNQMVRNNKDEDFHRGENAYEHHYGDPRQRNPNLGELAVAPFRAIKVMPGDIGTKGGLLTDECARVLDAVSQPIPGLYAAGNSTASVMGQTYPGPGSTLGPALVFGFIAGRHAARQYVARSE